jgi:hypothetical protein
LKVYLITLFHLDLHFPSTFIPTGSRTNNQITFVFFPFVPHSPPISFLLL